MNNSRILVVEDEPVFAAMLTELLQDEGYRVTCAGSAEEAAHHIETEGADYEALVTDVNLKSSMDGFELAFMFHGRKSSPATIFMTGDEPKELKARAPVGAVFLEKPFRPSEIVGVLDQLLSED